MNNVIKVKYSDNEWEDSELDSFEIISIEEIFPNFEYAVYTYGTEPYAGTGHIIIKNNSKFILHDLGHCSCYGPIERLNSDAKTYDTLEELTQNCSDGLIKTLESVLDIVKKLG